VIKIDKLTVCIVGFGNAGQGEYLRERSGNSHFELIRNNTEFNLLAVVDPRFAGKTIQHNDILVAPSVHSLERNYIDLAVIAAPTKSHQEVCRQVVDILKPRAILIEKPVGSTLEENEEIKKCLQSIPTVVVNYQRNYNKRIVKQIIDVTSFGYVRGVVYYSNGATNNASHGLALLISILGTPTNVSQLPNEKGGHCSDSNLDFVVDFGKARIFFMATEEKNYSMFRIELFGPKSSWLYDAGLERSEMKVRIEDPIYVGRFSLTNNPTITSIPDSESFAHVYKYLEKRIRGDSDLDPSLGASLDLAYEVHKVIESAQK